MDTYTIDFPTGMPLLNQNDRHHWAKKNALVQEIKTISTVLARTQGIPPMDRVEITSTYHPRDRRRRDCDNLSPTVKAIIDGLVAAGILPDDDHHHVTAITYRIHPIPTPTPHLTLVIRPLPHNQDHIEHS